jgi:UDP-N-acetylmuramate dehydrogenase
VEPEKSLRDAGFEGDLDSNALLAPLTTWKIGGPAELLASPATENDLALAISWAREHGIPWRILGNGSNLLVSDQGVQGLVVRIRKVLDAVVFDGPTVRAGAGASFPLLANQCAARGLAGLEFASGIPGTVGGAIIMNAGWHKYEIGNFVDQVRFLTPQGTIKTYSRSDCGFTYRSSTFRHRQGVVLDADLTLEHGERKEIESRLLAFVASRKLNQPTQLPSCGSVFEQPPGDFAGRLIDAAGLKGTRVGDVQVSPLHANFFVNLGHGTANDVLTLVRQVEEDVMSRFQVRLVREFEYWGS